MRMVRRRVPRHILKWIESLDRKVSLRKQPLFTRYPEGLVRIPHPGIPEYRWKRVRTKVRRLEVDD